MDNPTKQRNTRTKEAVAQIFQSFAAPISLNDLYQFIKVSLPKTAFSTIFRIVQRLEEEGKVVRIDWGERGSRYEWADLPHHHHLVCLSCGDVKDINDELLQYNEAQVAKTTGYQIKRHSIELVGLCPDCQKKVAAA